MPPLRHPHTGALFLVMSNGLTATVDAAAKYMSPSLHGVQVVWGYSLAITVLVLGYAAVRPESFRQAFATRRPLLQLGRGAMLFVTISMLFVALAYMPLADVIAISFAAPLFITLLAVPLLSERVGVHRIGAVVAGLVGVAIVIRPGAGVFEWAALLALGSALVFAFFQLATRVLATTEPPFTTLLYTGIGALACSSLAVPFFWRPISAFEIVVFVVIGALGVGAHVCMIRAYVFTQASFLAPFNYAKLLWAVALGYMIFGDVPQVHVIAGSVVIVASGLYVLYRERARH